MDTSFARTAHTGRRLLVALALLVLTALPAGAQEWTSARPDGHAPLGVMGDHTHARGEVMLSYRFMHMNMDGNLIDSDFVPVRDILRNWPVTPLEMPMQMHMAGLMYAPHDRVTLMGMVPIVVKEMDHVTRTGGQFTTETTGIGDVRATALVELFNASRQQIHLNAGVSFPTGSIDETDATPMGVTRLPYPMQNGSGTFDLHPGVTYLGQSDDWSWGAQGTGVIRLGENDNDYQLGDEITGTGWFARKINDRFSASARLQGKAWGDVDGADPMLNPFMVPTANPLLRQGRRVDVFAGINFEIPSGALDGNRLAVELGFPVFHDLDGPQLETDWTLVAGWQYAFQLFGEHH